VDHVQEIKEFIIAEFMPDIKADQLTADYDLIANGVIDSLSLLRVITWIGTRFDIPVEEIDISEENFVSAAAISEFVGNAKQSQFAGTGRR
jgi:acyl carrier protein